MPNRVSYSSNLGVDGFINDANTWTYASDSTFTVSGDVTTTFQKGTKLRFTQTTVKYGVVRSSSYSAPNTTVTIAVNSDYVIANAAITSPAYSYISNPQGYPGFFNFVPTFTGFSVDPTVLSCRYSIEGRMVFMDYVSSAPGTSNAANFLISVPVAAKITTYKPLGLAKNNGTYVGGIVQSVATSTNLTLATGLNAAGWISSGDKDAAFDIMFEMA